MTTEYTDRIMPGEAVYLAPNGRFHRPGCRYYVAPGPEAAFVEGTFTAAFLSNHCKLCFPQGLPVDAGAPPAEGGPPVEASAPAPPPSAPLAPAPEAAPPPPAAPLAPEQGAEPVLPAEPLPAEPLPAPPAAAAPHRGEERHRKRRKKDRFGIRPPAITRVQVAIFLAVVGLSVGVFVALAAFLNWFG